MEYPRGDGDVVLYRIYKELKLELGATVQL